MKEKTMCYRLADSGMDPEIYHSGYAGQTTNALFAHSEMEKHENKPPQKKAREIF